ncbi:hypothetical protein ACFSTC_07815 [Nonomuraea ferruginea]
MVTTCRSSSPARRRTTSSGCAELLDGIPLALELAAGCALAPGRIADRLGGRHGLLPASADGARQGAGRGAARARAAGAP